MSVRTISAPFLEGVTIPLRTGAFARRARRAFSVLVARPARRGLSAFVVRPALRALRALLALLALSSLSACAGFLRSEFGTPVVELKDVRMKGIGIQGGSLDLVLDVYNPNNYRLDTSRLTYTLSVDTAALATGAITKLVTLEAKKKTEVILPVTFSAKEIFGAAKIITQMGSLDYTVKGELTVATPFGNYTRPYQGKGRFDSLRR
jgi:LEA14-like dessication related protein